MYFMACLAGHGSQDSTVPGTGGLIIFLLFNDGLNLGSVARDFVEAPSQMLENWCWEPRVLERMSSHYETKKPLSPELIVKIVKRYDISRKITSLLLILIFV